METEDIKEELKLTREIARYYGLESRFNQMEEEMSELTQVFCKYRRVKNGEMCRMSMEEVRECIAEELADVYITLDQVLYLLDKEEWASFMCKLKEKSKKAHSEFKKKMEEMKNE